MDRGAAVVNGVASWPARERINAIKRIVSLPVVKEILDERRVCPRLPSWFLVWFLMARGVFCGDSCRQIFRWLQPSGRTPPPRSTFCEARKRWGVAPLRRLMERIVVLLGTRDTPGSFYKKWRLRAVDSFVLDGPDTLVNDRAFGRAQIRTVRGMRSSLVC